VIAVLARTTRRLPAELRGRVRADCRDTLILGMLDLGLALDEVGIRPVLTDELEQARLAAMPTLARALRGQAPPNGQVYRGRFQASLLVGPLALLLTAALEFGLALQSGSLFFMALIAVAELGFAPPLVLFILRRLRYPDIIVALPDGYITFYGSVLVQQHPFALMRSVAIRPTRLGSGVSLVNTPPDPSRPYTIPILPTFRARKRIAGRIVADFARYRQERGAGAIAGEGHTSGGRSVHE
jgi:hypothetical protein